MNRAFTLVELLVVMGIMGLLGTISVGGYRAMQRGMEERGVMENVNTLIRAAYQRAQIDRQPTAICFWNETLRGSTEDDQEIVVGKAVAIRRHGRLSDVRGQKLVDEFADLNKTYQSEDEEEENENETTTTTQSRFYLYPIDRLSDIQSSSELKRSVVKGVVVNANDKGVIYLSGNGTKPLQREDGANANEGWSTDSTSDDGVPAWAFEVVDAGGVEWKAGMAYGLEFSELTLPRGYIFGSAYSKDLNSPVQSAGTLVFDVGVNTGNGLTKGGVKGRTSIAVYSLRQSGAELKAEKVDDSDNPENDL